MKSKLHRLLKVLYITASIILIFYMFFELMDSAYRFEGISESGYMYKTPVFAWIFLSILIITLLQIIISDFIYRIGNYINSGYMTGFIKYTKIKLYQYIIFIVGFSIVSFLLYIMGSNFNNYCEDNGGEWKIGECVGVRRSGGRGL